MDAPEGVAKFDSAAAMAQALARFLYGQDFAALGESRLMQMVAGRAGWVPRAVRERIFAHLGAREGIGPDAVGDVRLDDVAAWVTGLFPQRRYPAIMIGSSNGALLHMAAALGIPWLPQTLLMLVEQSHVHPDDPVHAMEAELDTAERFLAANPNVQLHHMHDPGQDRLMLDLITYFRSKFLRLPQAYRGFIAQSLEPGGTIYVVDCERRWPTTRLGERYFYQFGAEGGPTVDEYFHGSERVADYLARYDSPVRCWEPPAPTGESPEAEWGFEPALRDDITDFARGQVYRVVRVAFDDPEDPSELVADFHRRWYREQGLTENRLVLESFVLQEPYWTLRTASVPFWMTFNMEPSLRRVQHFVDEREPFDEMYLMLFAHGVDSVGLPPIGDWRQLLERAARKGALLGIEPETYPAHFAHFAYYSQALRDSAHHHHPLPPPLPLTRFEDFVDAYGERYGVRMAGV